MLDNKHLFFSLSFGLSLGISGTAFAQEAEKETILDALVVTANRTAESKREVTSNISIIPEEVIESSSAANLGDLLGQQGFQIRKYPGTLTNLGIRGYRTNTHGNDLDSHVLILLNGRRVGTGNVAKIALSNVERIEVIRGPASVQYGSAAMGGVVNVITKRGQGPLNASVELGLGSFNERQAAVATNGEIGNVDYAMGYDYSKVHDYKTADGDRYRHTRKDGTNSMNMDLGYTFLQRHRLGVNLSLFDANDTHAPYEFGEDGYNITDKSNNAIDINYTGSSEDDRFSWMARYGFGRDKDKTLTFDPVYGDSHYLSKVNSQTGQAQLSYDSGSFRLTGGLDYVDYDLTDKSSYSDARSEYRNTAGFLLGKLRLLDERLVLSFGGRFDHYKVKLKDGTGGSETDTHFSPSIGLAYSPTEWLKLRANYAQAFVIPTARQLAQNTVTWGVRYVGNPNLDPETSDTYEVGFDIGWKSVDLGFTYFFTETRDWISTTSLPDGTMSYKNIGKAYRSGLEFELSGDVASFMDWDFELRPYANVNYMIRHKGRDSRDDGYTDLMYVPDLTIGYGIRFHNPGIDLSAALNFTYFGEETVQKWDSSFTPYKIKHGKFSVADLSLRQKIIDFDKAGKLYIQLQANNLFDRKYDYVDGYPMPGRSYFASLIYTY